MGTHHNENEKLVQTGTAESTYGTNQKPEGAPPAYSASMPNEPVFMPALIEKMMRLLQENRNQTYRQAESAYASNITQALIALKIRAFNENYQEFMQPTLANYEALLAQLHHASRDRSVAEAFRKSIKNVLEEVMRYVQHCHPVLYFSSANEITPFVGNNPLLDLTPPSAPPAEIAEPQNQAHPLNTKLFNLFFEKALIARLEQGFNQINLRHRDHAPDELAHLIGRIQEASVDEAHPENIMQLLHHLKNNITKIEENSDRKEKEKYFIKAIKDVYAKALDYALHASPAFAKQHFEIIEHLRTANSFITRTNCAAYACATLTPFELLYCGWMCDLGCCASECFPCCDSHENCNGCTLPPPPEFYSKSEVSLSHLGADGQDIQMITSGTTTQFGYHCGCGTRAFGFFKAANTVKESQQAAMSASYLR